jgi:polyhydroxybutyrate depolymerase
MARCSSPCWPQPTVAALPLGHRLPARQATPVRAADLRLRLALVLACALVAAQAPAQPPQADSGGSAMTLRERIAAWRAQRSAGQPVPPAQPLTAPGTYDFVLEHDGLQRFYRVHVPHSYDAARPTPVVFAFHGGGGSARSMSDDRFYGLIAKSEQAGFIAVFPNGYSRLRNGGLATFNAGICCGAARDSNIDDVGFVRKVVAQVRSQLNVDPDRIVASGMSNGAMLSYRLACEAADIFRAIVAVAGTDGMDACKPSRPVSVLHIHARDDDMVRFEGGPGKRSVTRANFRSVGDTIARWVRLDGCEPTPKRVLDLPGRASCESYGGCQGGAEVRLCVTETGGHSWPGGAKVRTGEPGSAVLQASDLIAEIVMRR